MVLNKQVLLYAIFTSLFSLTYAYTLITEMSEYDVEYLNNTKSYFQTIMIIDFCVSVTFVSLIIVGFSTMHLYILLLLTGCVQVQLVTNCVLN